MRRAASTAVTDRRAAIVVIAVIAMIAAIAAAAGDAGRVAGGADVAGRAISARPARA